MSFVLEDEPHWYKDAVIYELHVRAFYDSNADGIGDFQGLTDRLDYLQDLGITAIWLLPFYPSPLKDDGYDIADYMNVHPSYGTLQDFKAFLREAHRRGIRVIIELVVNHTSDQHAWFQRARRAKPGASWRDFYVWSDSPEKYRDARIIFKDFETSNWSWDPVANAYYWHRFYSHQPDLNFDNPEVVRNISQVMNFWLNLGVDGLRLDAVPYLYEREGTNCENLPETHDYLRKLRTEIDSRFRNRMLLAEANQWPEDAVAYFGAGDECHMAFHFPVMPRMFMALRMEDRFPIIDILAQTPHIPENAQWALFLRNHDELTLEMVTDEERDYMYRAYAHDPQMRVNLGIRRRLASLLGKDWNRIELMNALLFSLPGTPVLYYGDEIGMGDNIYLGDRNGVRTPMQWSADRNAGFSRSSPHRLYLPIITDPEFHYEAFNVEAQQNNTHSVLWWMKRLIALRKRYRAFGRGSLEFLYPENHRVLAFVRRYQGEAILVVANLSRFPQPAALDLSMFKGTMPVELFGRTEFPAITEAPYILTLGPHSFYWFAIPPQKAAPVHVDAEGRREEILELEVAGSWPQVFTGRPRLALEQRLPNYLADQRWFGGAGRKIKSARFVELLPVPMDAIEAYVTLVEVEYTEEDPEVYVLPLAFGSSDLESQTVDAADGSVLAHLSIRHKDNDEEGVLYDAVFDKRFGFAMVDIAARRKQLRGLDGELSSFPTRTLRPILNGSGEALEVTSVRAGGCNSSIVFGDRLVLRFFRKVESGPNPDLELGRFLTIEAGFSHCPQLAGSLQYRSRRGETCSIGILHQFIPNEGDAWQQALDALSQYFDRALMQPGVLGDFPQPVVPLVKALAASASPPPNALDLIGPYYEAVKLLGRRTAELHVALASNEDPDYAPEPFTVLYQRSLYQSMRNHAGQMLFLLKRNLQPLPGMIADDVLQVLDSHGDVLNRFRLILSHKISAKRTRIHGDYQLEKVLYTGKDYVIFDFKGPMSRPLTERRLKRSPLRDVAGMMRSFHYAAYSALFGHLGSGMVRPEDVVGLEPWARNWTLWISAAFLESYLTHAQGGGFLPNDRQDIEVLLEIYLLEKALSELGYEVQSRPQWVRIPLIGIRQILEPRRPSGE